MVASLDGPRPACLAFTEISRPRSQKQDFWLPTVSLVEFGAFNGALRWVYGVVLAENSSSHRAIDLDRTTVMWLVGCRLWVRPSEGQDWPERGCVFRDGGGRVLPCFRIAHLGADHRRLPLWSSGSRPVMQYTDVRARLRGIGWGELRKDPRMPCACHRHCDAKHEAIDTTFPTGSAPRESVAQATRSAVPVSSCRQTRTPDELCEPGDRDGRSSPESVNKTPRPGSIGVARFKMQLVSRMVQATKVKLPSC